MSQDFIAFGILGGMYAGAPSQVASAFAKYLDSGDKAYTCQWFLDYAKWHIDSFAQWAYRQADDDTALLAEIDDYVDKLYDWIKGGRSDGKLDEVEHRRLSTRKQNLTDKLGEHIPARLIKGGQDSINELLNRVEDEVYVKGYPMDPSAKWFDVEIERLSLAYERVGLARKLIEKIYPVGRDKDLLLYRLPDIGGEIASYCGLLGTCRDSLDWSRIGRGIGDYRKKLESFLSEIKEIRRAEGTPEPTEPGQKEEDETVVGLPKAARLAYLSYEYAVSKKSELADATDNDVYNWLKEHGAKDDYKLPDRETWKRYVGAGRKHHGTQKNTPRAGREGHSTVRSSQIQALSEVSWQHDGKAD